MSEVFQKVIVALVFIGVPSILGAMYLNFVFNFRTKGDSY